MQAKPTECARIVLFQWRRVRPCSVLVVAYARLPSMFQPGTSCSSLVSKLYNLFLRARRIKMKIKSMTDWIGNKSYFDDGLTTGQQTINNMTRSIYINFRISYKSRHQVSLSVSALPQHAALPNLTQLQYLYCQYSVISFWCFKQVNKSMYV